jgi:SH3 domain protein
MLFSSSPAEAQSRYVKPSAEAAVRRGQGTEYKITAMVKDGTLVQLLEENDDFAKIQLSNGKEGWILKRFLSAEPPLDKIVASLRVQQEKMLQQTQETNQQLDTVTTLLAKTEQERNLASNERDQLRTSYKKLKEATANVMQIKKDMQQTSMANKALNQKLVLLEQENNTLRNDHTFKWFLAGGGVLLLGMLMGRITARSRKRKPSLL